MKRTGMTTAFVAFAWSTALFAPAQTFQIRWYSIEAGGGSSSDGLPGGLELTGAIGQPEAGDGAMTGSGFTLTGGFISGVAALLSPLPCPGDVDGDRDVDVADLARILSCFGRCLGDPAYDPSCDLNGDGCVDVSDLALILSNFGTAC